jgi:hypothetical protein
MAQLFPTDVEPPKGSLESRPWLPEGVYIAHPTRQSLREVSYEPNDQGGVDEVATWKDKKDDPTVVLAFGFDKSKIVGGPFANETAAQSWVKKLSAKTLARIAEAVGTQEFVPG